MSRKGYSRRSRMRGAFRLATQTNDNATGEGAFSAGSAGSVGDEAARPSSQEAVVETTSTPNPAHDGENPAAPSLDSSDDPGDLSADERPAGDAHVAEPPPEEGHEPDSSAGPVGEPYRADTAGPAAVTLEWPSAPTTMEIPGGDDVSVPPVDLDTRFFETHPTGADASLEIDTRDPRIARKLTASAARRRAHLSKYVAVAVALSSALCMAALVKAATSQSNVQNHAENRDEAVARAASAPILNTSATTVPGAFPALTALSTTAGAAAAAMPTAATAGPVVAEAVTTTAPPTPTVAADPAKPSEAPAPPAFAPNETSGSLPVPASPPRPAAPPSNAPAAAVVAPAAGAPPEQGRLDPRSASKEKSRAQAALEGGRFADALAAGERSVALDPGDAETWLILGAAYQAKGAIRDATRCFKSCADLATRGPKSECAAMLRTR